MSAKYLSNKPDQESIREAITGDQILSQLSYADINHIVENTEMEYFIDSEFIILERVDDNHKLILVVSGSVICFKHDHEDNRVKVCYFHVEKIITIS